VARGHQILEEQFPGLTDQLVAAGIRPGDFNGDFMKTWAGPWPLTAPVGVAAFPRDAGPGVSTASSSSNAFSKMRRRARLATVESEKVILPIPADPHPAE
jgi:hypothetical protein